MVGCGIGYFEDQDSCECEICPIGTYNDQDDVETCTSCPTGWTTLQSGSTLDSQCRLSKKIISVFNFSSEKKKIYIKFTFIVLLQRF